MATDINAARISVAEGGLFAGSGDTFIRGEGTLWPGLIVSGILDRDGDVTVEDDVSVSGELRADNVDVQSDLFVDGLFEATSVIASWLALTGTFQAGYVGVGSLSCAGHFTGQGSTYISGGYLDISPGCFFDRIGEVDSLDPQQGLYLSLYGGHLAGSGDIGSENSPAELHVQRDWQFPDAISQITGDGQIYLSTLEVSAGASLIVSGRTVTVRDRVDVLYDSVLEIMDHNDWGDPIWYLKDGTLIIHSDFSTSFFSINDHSKIEGEGLLRNTGIMGNSGPFKIMINAPFRNEGKLVVRSVLQFPRGFVQEGNGGATEITPLSALEIDGGGMNVLSGLVFGAGTIRSTLVKNAGKFAPGESYGTPFIDDVNPVYGSSGSKLIGTLKIQGNYEQTAAGSLNIDLSPDGHDLLDITGSAKLGGVLNVRCFSAVGKPTTILRARGGIASPLVSSNGFAKVNGFPDNQIRIVGNEVRLIPARVLTVAMNPERLAQGREFVDGSCQSKYWRYCGYGQPRCCGQLPFPYPSDILLGRTDAFCRHPLNPVDSCGDLVRNQYNISQKGCVLASAAMVTNNLIFGDVTLVDPYTMNLSTTIFEVGKPATNCPDEDFTTCGVSNCKVRSNKVVWERVADLLSTLSDQKWHVPPVTPPVVNSGSDAPTVLAQWQDLIAGHLWTNLPVAVRVNGGHTVLAINVEFVGDGSSRVRKIRIQDPVPFCGESGMVEYLDKYEEITEIKVVRPKHQPVINIRLNSPAELLMADGQGRRTGFDVATGSLLFEIPSITYEAEWENDADIAENPGSPPTLDRNEAHKVAVIAGHSGEDLDIQILGTGEGEADFAIERAGGAVGVEVVSRLTLFVSAGSAQAIVLTVPGSGDRDGDGDVDLVDHTGWPSCATVPGAGAVNEGCAPLDADADRDVDLSDYAAFQRFYSGCQAGCDGTLCGNGRVDVLEGELCDPPDGSGCGSDCRPVCGNGTVQLGEECDPPDGLTCDLDCQLQPPPPGDFDGDGDVDLDDWVAFAPCLTGPAGVANLPTCQVADFDADFDVDLADIAAFVRASGH